MSSGNKANILGIRPALEGVYVTLKCGQCTRIFEAFLATVAGHALGRFNCSDCAAIYEITPDDFLLALERFLPVKNRKEIAEFNRQANQIVESWYRVSILSEIMSYRGINLGEPAERSLFPHIALGLYLDDKKRPKE